MPSPTWLVGAVQMTSGADRARNLEVALRLVNEAADLGARLVGLPENFAFMGPEPERIAGAETVEGPTVSALRELARRRGVFVLAGSIAEKVDAPGKTANTSVLVGDDGVVVAVYRKIHLFDVNIPDGARYAESETVVPGDRPVLAETALGPAAPRAAPAPPPCPPPSSSSLLPGAPAHLASSGAMPPFAYVYLFTE